MRQSFKNRYGSAGVAALLFAFSAHAMRAQAAFPEFRVVKGSVTSDDDPRSGALLCAAKDCFEMPAETIRGTTYQFALEPKGTRLPFGSGSVVLFSAGFNAGGPGWIDRLALLREDPNGRMVNLLPYVSVSKQGESATWTLDDVPTPLLVTANPSWNFEAGETRWDSHDYEVTVYRYDKTADRYVQAVRYITSKKYASGDAEPIHVLAPEREEALRRLRAAQQ